MVRLDQTQMDSIISAINSRSKLNSPTFIGTVSLPTTTSIGTVSDIEIAHLDGTTSNIQGQLDSADSSITYITEVTGGIGGIRQTVQGGRADTEGRSNILSAQGDPFTKHLHHFNSSNILDESGTTWKAYNASSINTTTFKVGTGSLNITGATGYIETTVPSQYRSFNTWSEEIWYRPTVLGTQKILFSGVNAAGYGVYVDFSSANKPMLYLSSNGTSWNLASAVLGTTVAVLNTWYHFALSFNGTDYTLKINGNTEITIQSALKICSITKRRVGHSTVSAVGFLDEHRFSGINQFPFDFVVDTAPVQYDFVKSLLMDVYADNETPLTVSYSMGDSEIREKYSTVNTVNTLPFTVNHIYTEKNIETGEVTFGSTPIAPMYGDSVTNGWASTLPLEDTLEEDLYGNTWSSAGVTLATRAGSWGTKVATFANAGTLSSDMTMPIGSFSMRTRVLFDSVVASDNTIISAKEAFSFLLRVGTGSKIQLYVSTTGTSWNVASGLLGTTTLVVGTWYDIIVSYSAVYGYQVWVNGKLEIAQTVTYGSLYSDSTTLLELGSWQGGGFLQGSIDFFELTPYNKYYGVGNITVPAEIPVFNTEYTFFQISNMLMLQATEPSPANGAPAVFGKRIARVYLGYASTDINSVTSYASYSFNGRYETKWFLTNLSSAYGFSHLIGCNDVEVHVYFNSKNTSYGMLLVDWAWAYNTTLGNQQYGAKVSSITPYSATITSGAAYLTQNGNTTGYYNMFVTRRF